MKLAKYVELSGLRVDYSLYIGWDLSNQLIELRGKVTPWQRREFCSLLPSDSGLQPQLLCGSPGDSLSWRLEFLVVLSQFFKTNHSLCNPAGSVCTSHGVFWRTVTHEHCKACFTVLHTKPNVLGSITSQGQFLTAQSKEHLILPPFSHYILLVATTQGIH